jgi:hypothetical protein
MEGRTSPVLRELCEMFCRSCQIHFKNPSAQLVHVHVVDGVLCIGGRAVGYECESSVFALCDQWKKTRSISSIVWRFLDVGEFEMD